MGRLTLLLAAKPILSWGRGSCTGASPTNSKSWQQCNRSTAVILEKLHLSTWTSSSGPKLAKSREERSTRMLATGLLAFRKVWISLLRPCARQRSPRSSSCCLRIRRPAATLDENAEREEVDERIDQCLQQKKMADAVECNKLEDKLEEMIIMRQIPSPTHRANANCGCGAAPEDNKHSARGVPGDYAERKEFSPSNIETKSFKVGDHVLYSSSLHGKLPAVVEEIRSDGLYNLNVKRGAKAENMELRIEQGNARKELQVVHVVQQACQVQEAAEQLVSNSQHESRSQPVDAQSNEQSSEQPKLGLASVRHEPEQYQRLMLPIPVRTPLIHDVTNTGTTGSSSIPGLAASSANQKPTTLVRHCLPYSAQPVQAVSDASPSSSASTPGTSKSSAIFHQAAFRLGEPGRASRATQPPSAQPSSFSPPTARNYPAPIAPSPASECFAGAELVMSGCLGNKFDAKEPSIRHQLVAQLGLAESAVVEDMPGFQGGLNEGIWNLRDSRLGEPGRASRATQPPSAQPSSFSPPTARNYPAPIAPSPASECFAGAELVMSGCLGNKFDAKEPSIRHQLVAQLGLAESAVVEDMPGFQGGLNEGIWNLRDSKQGASQELVLKLVKCQRIATNVPTEAENFAKLRTQHPQLATDPVAAFPLRIFSCTCGGEKRNDLIVMRKVRGERFSEFVAWKNVKKQTSLLLRVFEKIGKALAEFHARYGNMQHGDFQPSNIFYDEAGDSLFFIDLGGMGVQCMDNDVQHFTSALSRMSGTYSGSLISGALQAFDRGYRNPSASSPLAAGLVHSPVAAGVVAGGARLVSIAQGAQPAVQAPRFFRR
eukprot:TRINITY_DN4204_c0_g1_i9.p1 TRINITY_DN4204_c0_g1~~TRINITY_DN4204_c0_g1_i9.p1  ORF type:complete len:828 (+),score=147.87 TRINITY_DN4204_c0_g1_i9:133-2616(+)